MTTKGVEAQELCESWGQQNTQEERGHHQGQQKTQAEREIIQDNNEHK